MPQTSAAARTQTGEARNATMPRGFDGVPGGAPGEEVLGKRTASAVDTFRAPDLLDQEPERDIHEVLIQPAAANARWNGDIRHLTRPSGTESQCGSDQSLGERKSDMPSTTSDRIHAVPD
jgi:hypothetical protein